MVEYFLYYENKKIQIDNPFKKGSNCFRNTIRDLSVRLIDDNRTILFLEVSSNLYLLHSFFSYL